MVPGTHLLAFAAVAAVLIAIPGPSVVFTISRALAVGRKAALFTVVGNELGGCVQVAAVAFGIGAVVQRSAEVFTVLKLAGAGYLVRRPLPRHDRPEGSMTALRRPGLATTSAALALAVLPGCASPPVVCAGQCAPPYELQVSFKAGTPPATVRSVLARCAAHDPVVIRVGQVQARPGELIVVMVYTRSMRTVRTSALVGCLQSAGAGAGWPD